jgi:hypothetical protein
VTRVIVGASTPERMEDAVAAFEAAGFKRTLGLDEDDGDLVLGVSGGGADLLLEADRRAIRYVLVHDGGTDGHAGGTYERAHHRIDAGQRGELAQHLRGRERPLVTCLAFAYKNGAPFQAALVVDARFLDNPYWVPELKERTGLDPDVVDYVMRQAPAGRVLDRVEGIVRDLVPLYIEKGRTHVVVAFGCTGGRHRSVVLAAELAKRLKAIDGIDVEFATRDI